MTDIICPLCGKANPPELDECQYCQAPLKTSGFIASPQDEEELNNIQSEVGDKGKAGNEAASSDANSNLEDAIPDWLKATEAGFLDQPESGSEEHSLDQFSDQIDAMINQPPTSSGPQEPLSNDDWLASLLSEADASEAEQPGQENVPPQENVEEPEPAKPESVAESPAGEEEPSAQLTSEKPQWLTDLEASSSIKFESEFPPGEPGAPKAQTNVPAEKPSPEPPSVPDWVTKSAPDEGSVSPIEPETEIAPAELPGWLEALRPAEPAVPSGPVEDVSSADIATAGPLVGLRGVISAHPSAIRAQKPPTYSIKLRVTDEQRARVEMMEELLADEQKPTPLPSKPIITSRNIFRLVIAIALILPVFWMIITKSQQAVTPQPGNIPGVVDFTQQIQMLPSDAPILLSFDYEAGFSGELNDAITTLMKQLMAKNAYLTLVATNPSGPALAESLIRNVSTTTGSSSAPYTNFTDLGYIPGGTMGLLGLAVSPKAILPYSLDANNVWAAAPLNAISSITDFKAVIVITNDADTARAWIEQVGVLLNAQHTPLLVITSSQAEPMIRPYYESSQVQGMVAGFAGGLAYGRTIGNVQQSGVWDAYSVGVTVSVLIILIGAIAGIVIWIINSSKEKEG